MIKTIPRLAAELNKIAPTRLYEFSKPQAPPFIIYLDEGEDNFYADDEAYVDGALLTIEVYVKLNPLPNDKKLFAIINELKAMFKLNNIDYERGPTIPIESEGLLKCDFTVRL